jgi:superoxide dismutase, Fe-Mn family
MRKFKLLSIIIIVGFLGLPCTFFSHAQMISDKDTEKNPTNQSKIQTSLTPVNPFEFQPLPYAYDALEPYIDKLTVEIHYSKHQRAYYDNYIKAILGTQMESMDIKDIMKDISNYPIAVRNNGGGYFNHVFYWEGMKAHGGGEPTGKLSEAIIRKFGSFDEFKRLFSEAGKARFGSGWAWLCLDNNNDLFICSTPNQDNPLMDLPGSQTGLSENKGIPLLALDLWEHAYYLKYQNRRADYIDAFWNVVDWEIVAKRYETALKTL